MMGVMDDSALRDQVPAKKRELLDLLSAGISGGAAVNLWQEVHGVEHVSFEYTGNFAEAASTAFSEVLLVTQTAWFAIVNDLLDLLEHEGPARDRREVIEMLRADAAED